MRICLLHSVVVLAALACRSEPQSGKDGLADDPVDTAEDADGDGFSGDDDCNDGDAAVSPSAVELCDGIDNDCDGQVDEEVTDTFFLDADADGFGDAAVSEQACAAPEGYVPESTDCDDADDTVHPGAEEVCDGVDNDCDELTDEDVGTEFFADTDDDGYGDPGTSVVACELPTGFVVDATDCDDTEPTVYPGAEEICDELDNDCNDVVDEGVTLTWYVDLDDDDWGDLSATTEACTEPTGYAAVPGDCDDNDAAVHPDATEVCNSIDDDCDALIDDLDHSVDTSTGAVFYADADSDGYGDPDSSTLACVAPSGTVSDATDCDDGAVAVHPGATEVCNEIDDDCDGDIDDADSSLDTSTASTWYVDSDGDGYGDSASSSLSCDAARDEVADSTDCDDADSTVHPGASEVCDDEDNDCDGDIDDADSSLDTSTASTWYTDSDGDGYGDSASSSLTCDAASDEVSDNTDCDDTDGAIHPGATEVCDDEDNDCDGDIDDADSSLDTSTASTWYADSDGDGYGDAAVSSSSCEAASDEVSDDSDCDDDDPTAHPGGVEVVDGADNDCDGAGLDGTYTASSGDTLTGGEYEYTDFTIPSGVTLTATGSDPVEVYVLGDIDISGTLDLIGDNGAAAGWSDGSAAAGGSAGAGGGAGGNGAILTTTSAVDGAGDAGGTAGVDGMIGGGGGGGGHASAGQTGSDGQCVPSRCGSTYTVAGGAGGASVGSSTVASLQAGSGGGGGGFARADNGDGGGGGGGGGAVFLYGDTIDVSGTIDASGGDGGSESSGSDGAAGGGGSAGTIWLEAWTSISVSGYLYAQGGSGGTTVVGGTAAYGGAGGDGADGRIWLDAPSVSDSGATVSPAWAAP